MRTATAGLILLLVSIPVAAHAQTPPKMAAGGSVGFILPQSDADDFADPSAVVRAQFIYWVHPMVGVVGSFDYVFVSEEDGVNDVTYYDVSAGARVRTRGEAKLKPFGELLIGRHTLAVEDNDFDDSDVGFRLGGGATYDLGVSIQAIGELSYSTVEIGSGFELDIDGFIFEAGLLALF